LSGDSSIGSKLDSLDLNSISTEDFNLIFSGKTGLARDFKEFFNIAEDLQHDKRLRLISDLEFTYNISKYAFTNTSMRIRLFTILFGSYKFGSIIGFKLFVKHICKFRNLLMLIPTVFGLLKIPKCFLFLTFFLNKKKVNKFFQNLDHLELDLIILFSSGYDNLTFLFNTFFNNKNTKLLMIINNWDNPSSKSFISEKFNFVALWNKQQMQHISKFNKISENQMHIIGSTTADLAYSKYEILVDSVNSNEKKLLYIGQQNNYDELNDLMKINAYIRGKPNSFYKRLIYRPHPLSKFKIKRLESNKHKLNGIDILLGKTVNLTEYDGIICLPTTFILEVVLSKRPALIYAPKSKVYRRNPARMWEYIHFNEFKDLGIVSVSNKFSNLKRHLDSGLPAQNSFESEKFYDLFPKFADNYSTRLLTLIHNIKNIC